jgi:Rap1a immunity proteins
MDMPDGVTREQAVRVVIAYIDAQPAWMHENFGVLALEALREAWPCK